MASPQPAHPEPVPITLPPNFQIQWPEPEMALRTWQQDRMHVPEPITPMSAWLTQHFAFGFTEGLAGYSIPMGAKVARLNTYFFLSIMPNVPPEAMPEKLAEAEPKMIEAAGNFWSRWENEWLPEIKGYWEEWQAFDLEGADDTALARALDRLIEIYRRIWTIHFSVIPPAFISISGFQDIYADLFPDASPLDAYRLLQGNENMSLEVDRALWALSRELRANASLRDAFGASPAKETLARLPQTPAGHEFGEHLNAFLARYGRRSNQVQELVDPSWTEDPTPALDSIRAYAAQDEAPDVNHARLAAEAERLANDAREAISGYPDQVRAQFEFLLFAARSGSRVQEDHNFWIDQIGQHEMRQFCLEVGNRLTSRGQLASKHDIFMLDMDEAFDFLRTGADARPLSAQRRVEIEHWRKIAPPPFVGTDYGPPPDNPLVRAILRFWGAPPAEAPTASRLSGNPGSPGTVTGTARIIRTVQEGGRLAQGEILVAPTTAPPWTPLFAIAGGIVTDAGGALSHCAIVAREYGLPAVVGAAGATSIIPDGAMIEVDGNKGLVRILS